jgi:hypothetical protein
MKRQVPGLAETARDSRPEVSQWHLPRPGRWRPVPLARAKAVLCPSPLDPRTQCASGSIHYRPPVLHTESDVEAGLVPAGFSL